MGGIKMSSNPLMNKFRPQMRMGGKSHGGRPMFMGKTLAINKTKMKSLNLGSFNKQKMGKKSHSFTLMLRYRFWESQKFYNQGEQEVEARQETQIKAQEEV
jgi:hypothetical protein